MPPGRATKRGPSATRLRPARRADAPAIAAIYNQSVRATTATFDTRPRSAGDQRERLRHHDARHPLWVATVNAKVVGWASLSRWSDRPAYDATAEFSVYVDEAWRGRGIGGSLLRRVLAVGKQRGLHTVLARIAEGNPASRSLHISAGFRPVGVMREVGRKFGRRLDVELLQVFLGSPRRAPGTRGSASRGGRTQRRAREGSPAR